MGNEFIEGKTVLIAEDEVEIRDLLSLMFKTEGFAVIAVSDGQAALDIMRNSHDKIDLLFTDLGLPKLGGIELIKEARTLSPSLKVIAASGFGHPDVRTELHKLGVGNFFSKPFAPAELLAAAKKLLAGE